MANRTQGELNRAMEDLRQGVSVLFGLSESGPNFVGSLLRGHDESERESVEQKDDSRRRARRHRSSGRSKARLVRIK